jgi:glucose 1-dehydrogenase
LSNEQRTNEPITITKKLKNRIAIVTGSDSGIGQAIAIAFAHEGADIVITRHTDTRGIEDTKREIEKIGQRVIIVELDQKNLPDIEKVFQQAKEKLGIPTILVNNAAADSIGKEVKDITIEEWDEKIRTNLYGPFYFCKCFIRELELSNDNNKNASIINITSVHQEIPRAGASDYCAAKGALRNLTYCLALELAEKNITVNNIAPGMVLTPMNQEAMENPQARKEEEKSIPVKRAAEPEEIAHAAVFLASDDARYIHGTSIFIDGGLMQYLGKGA